jgi:two-component system phosphate regulon sensor histidine kinase PhoR
MRSPLFRKLAALAFVLIAATLAAIDYAVGSYVREQRVNAVESRLVTAGRLIAASLGAPGSASADPANAIARWCQISDARLQWIDSNSKVTAACDEDAGGPGTVVSEFEVQDALSGRVGKAMRSSDGELYSYIAVPLRPSGGEPGALRLIEPVRAGATATGIRSQVASIAFAAAAIALIVAYRVTVSLARRVSHLKLYAEALLEGPGLETGISGQNDELGSLERSLHRVAAQLHELFERWSLESTRSEAILSSMAEGVLAVDRDLRVVFCNQAVTRAMGVRAPVKERTPVLEFMRDSELVSVLKRVVTSGENVKQYVKMATAGGRAFEVQAAPFATAGGKGALAIFYDMTDLERLEQVRKDFVANVSHEMRTPLAAIVGYADTLLDGGLEDPENNFRFVEVIRANAMRLNNIASDLLVLSELESGNSPGEPERVSVRAALDNAMSTMESEARSRNVQLLRGEIQDARVLGYRFRLEQAMLNLLVNAVKFNREGGEVRVSAQQTDGHIRIAVADTGVGIPSQDLPRIFERFYRVDKARSRQVGGTGLGLSIVRHVVERMGGKIEVESQLGRGSTFTIVLPAV